ncbi:MAG TPA: acetyl-CoA hydrolase/transferase C-terminal domain-containing protein [Anaerolineales bacterium]|nr:acetyl-CoA hydrolase/transferase C-terminal domain-containing protein [Anaerolineales bacterium]
MNWAAQYVSQVTTAEAAVAEIRSGDRVFLTGNCSVPQRLLEALVLHAPKLKDVEMVNVLTIGPAPHADPAMEGHLRVNTLFISDNVRAAVHEGRADFTPVLLSEVPHLFRNGHLPLDVALIHVSPPDEHGFCSLGIEAGLIKTPAQVAKLVIAEVNQQMPRTLGDSFIHISKIHKAIPVDYPLAELPMGNVTELSKRIGRYVADLVDDGSTMQMGIGAIPDAVLQYLGDKRDLGVHTELFSDGVMHLVRSGVITNEKKTLHPGKIVAGFILGSKALYDFVDDNPIVELHPTEYVNDPFVIAQNDRMVSINSALEIDLTGQVCADSIGPRPYSGVGGQMDFVYGAARSRGGKPIIALPSTATLRDGTRLSRLVPMLKPGAGVTTSRNHVHYVATEYGVAHLYGKTLRQRSRALIDIAHPDYREELERQAVELRYA